MLTIEQLRKEFLNLTAGWSWEVEGIIDKQDMVHPIDTDTKVISTVFERLSSPVLRTIAKLHGYVVETANQTTYPDFSLSFIGGGALHHRIAIDVKTTYKSPIMGFTLGGYNSFLRNNTKNILYPYDTYSEHWIIGFLYRQNPRFREYSLEDLPQRGEIQCPYTDVSVFLREKHAIAGLRAGSGNTKNIGSIKLRSSSEFSTIDGPFMNFSDSKGACDHYWRNYELYSTQISSVQALLAHQDFHRFL